MWGENACAGGESGDRKNVGEKPRRAVENGFLELERTMVNPWCSGETHRYHEKLEVERQHRGSILTLRHESVGREQD